MSEASGIHRGTIHRIELGQVSPRVDTLKGLCAALGADLEELFHDRAAAGRALPGEDKTAENQGGLRQGMLEWLAHLEALIQNSADTLMVLDGNGYLLYEARTTASLFGDGLPRRRSLPWPEWAHPEDQPLLWARFQALLQDPATPLSLDYRVAKGGAWRWVTSNCTNQLGHSAIQGIIISSHDSSRLKQLELDLKASEGRLRAIVDAIPDLYLLLGEDGTILELHACLPDFPLGQRTELLGTRFQDLPLPQEVLQGMGELIQAAFHSEAVETRVFTLDVNGESRIQEARVKRNASSEALLLLRDLTDQRRAEGERQRVKKLESLAVAAGGVAHQFTNLLMGIQGHLELLSPKLPEDPRVRKHLDGIRASLGRASYITHQLRDFANTPILSVEPTGLNQLIQKEAASFPEICSPLHDFQYQLAPGLPKVLVDPRLLQRVVFNLISNACESIGEQPGTVRVRTEQVELSPQDQSLTFAVDHLERSGAFVVLTVEDTGCGVSPAILPRIFDPFFTTKFTGRGLGLSAVQGIVRAHSGGIRVEDRPGGGTRFQVFLPCLDGSVPERRPAQAELLAPRRGARILVAEDDDVLRSCLCQMLEATGYEAVEARDGQEAVAAYRRGQGGIDLVLLDLNMPVMDGREAFAAIRALNPDSRIILSVGSCEDSFGNPAEPRHLSGVLHKPYQFGELEDMLRRVL